MKKMLCAIIALCAATVFAALPPKTGFTEYTVKRGDTLSGIAARSGTTVKALMAENKKIIKKANKIFAGQVIYVPATAPAIEKPNTVGRTYLVTVYDVAPAPAPAAAPEPAPATAPEPAQAPAPEPAPAPAPAAAPAA